MKEHDAKQLLDVITQQNKVLERVIAERDELRQHLENLAPDAPDALACLRRVYNDPKAKEVERVKAASAAIGYERAKPASVSVVIDFKERVRAARMRTVELQKAEWARQEAQKKSLGLDEPSAPTLLGGPEGDPAA
jgi:hypothetical protein